MSEAHTSAPLLAVKHLGRRFALPRTGLFQPAGALQALSDVSFTLQPGKSLGIVGESGSGKTTIGRAAIGLLPISGGKLEVVGQDISHASQKDLRSIRRQTGIVFQDPASSLNPRLPIGESIGEPLLLAALAGAALLPACARSWLRPAKS